VGQSDLGISAHNFAYCLDLMVWDPGKCRPAKCNAAL